eukprot:SAG11_NODE_536_length_8674_cov_6.314985_6_plen_68_part_00
MVLAQYPMDSKIAKIVLDEIALKEDSFEGDVPEARRLGKSPLGFISIRAPSYTTQTLVNVGSLAPSA